MLFITINKTTHKEHKMRTFGLALAAVCASAAKITAQESDLEQFCATCEDSALRIIGCALDLQDADWEDYEGGDDECDDCEDDECDDCEDDECDDCDINYDSNGDGVWNDEEWYYYAWNAFNNWHDTNGYYIKRSQWQDGWPGANDDDWQDYNGEEILFENDWDYFQNCPNC